MIKIFDEKDRLPEKIITVFILIFTATLASTIFINQIGYYGGLAVLLFLAWKNKKNPFPKSGIEWFLAVYMTAVFVSALFSSQTGEAMHNFMKRLFLIPIIYTMAASSGSEDKIKLFYRSVVLLTAITGLIYTGFAWHSYVTAEILRTGSGPATFQHPITASQMFTFAMMMALAAALNRDEKPMWRVIMLVSAVILLLALLGTFKRTGLLGAFVAIVFMLAMDRRWILTGLIIAGLVIAILLEHNISTLYVYKNFPSPALVTKIDQTGHICSPIRIDTNYFMSEYDKGLVRLDKNFKPDWRMQFPLPVLEVMKVNDSLFGAMMFDFSVQLLKPGNGLLKKYGEPFISPGATAYCMAAHQNLYFYDVDSGLTVYRNLTGNIERVRMPQFGAYANFSIDNSHVLFYNSTNKTCVIELDSAGLPGKNSMPLPFEPKTLSFGSIYNGYLIGAINDSVRVFRISSDSLNEVGRIKNEGTYNFLSSTEDLLITQPSGVLKFNLNSEKFTKVQLPESRLTGPYYIYVINDTAVVSYYKNGRFNSFWDPYSTSNYSRMAFWRASIKIFLDYPLFGIGDIDVADYYIKYKRPSDKEVRGHFHNNFLHTLATLGGVGFLLFCALIGAIVYRSIKVFRECARRNIFKSYALGLNGVIIAFLFAGLSEWNFGRHAVITFFWLAFGLLIAIAEHLKKTDNSRPDTKI